MSTDDLDSRLLPLPQAAARLGVATSDLSAAIDAGELPCVRIGAKGILVDFDELRAALLARAKRREVSSEPP